MTAAAWRRPWQIAVQRWRVSHAMLWCTAMLAVIALGALVVPFITFAMDDALPAAVWQSPTPEHWLGTDHIGRDVFVQLLWACRASLAFALTASGVSLVLGVMLGALTGYYGGWWDRYLMRLLRLLEALPLILLVIGIAAAARLDWMGLALLAGAVTWMPIARRVQRCMRALRDGDFAAAVQIVGARPARVLWQHLAPHLTSVANERALRAVAHMLLLDAALGLLGLGPQAPRVSLGAMLATGVAELETHPHLFIAAALLLTLTIYCFTALADAWREVRP